MKELHPTNQNVVLDLSGTEKEQLTAGGIIIPDTAKEKPQMAPVVWINAMDDSEVKTGNLVIFKPFSGTEIDFEGKKYLILPSADILAKIVKTEEI